MRNRAENQMRQNLEFVFIRHGETKANREGRYLGRTDESLSGRGKKALLSYKGQACYPDVQILFSSPMKRCLETAEIIYPGLHPIVIPEWREMDFGLFEYQNYEELKDDAQYRAWLESNGALPFPEGERREEFISRCEAGFLRVCGELERIKFQDAGRLPAVGMVVHGGTIMALLSLHGKGDYFDYQVACGRGYRCRFQGGDKNEFLEIEEI